MKELLKKLNFEKGGVLRDWLYWNDNYLDILMYSKIKR